MLITASREKPVAASLTTDEENKIIFSTDDVLNGVHLYYRRQCDVIFERNFLRRDVCLNIGSQSF